MHPFWTSFAVFFFLLCVASLYHWRFLRRIRREFPTVWQDMGRPTGWTDSTLLDAFGTYLYLLRRRYQQSSDVHAIQFCERFRIPMLVTYAGAWLSVAVFFIGLFIWGKP